MSWWRPVRRCPSGGISPSVLGSTFYYLYKWHSEIECTLRKSADDTKLSDADDILWGRDAILRYLERLEKWDHVNLMKFIKAKWKVLHLGQSNPKHRYRLCDEWIESSPAKKDLRVLVHEKLDMSWQWVCVCFTLLGSWASPQLLSQLLSSKEEGKKKVCWKEEKRLMGWDKGNLIKGEIKREVKKNTNKQRLFRSTEGRKKNYSLLPINK